SACWEVRRRLHAELLKQRLKHAIRRLVTHSRFEAQSYVETMCAVLCDLERKINIAISPRESRRSDSYNRVGFSNELQTLSNHVRIRAKMTLPEFVAQHDDRLWVLTIDRIGRQQSASQGCRNTKELEGIRRQIDSIHVFREVSARQCQIPVVFGERIFHGRRLLDQLVLAACQPETVLV